MNLQQKIVILFFLCSLYCNSQSWEGKWIDKKGGCDLIITNVTATSFSFSFDCFNGKDFGSLDSKAKITGNTARYDGIEKDITLCPIDFVLTEKGITINEDRKKDCDNGAGQSVTFSGKYIKKVTTKKTRKK